MRLSLKRSRLCGQGGEIELNSKTQNFCNIGTINKGDNMLYDSEEITSALQEAYASATSRSIILGVLYASRSSTSAGTYWTIMGIKSSGNYGYLSITTYGTNETEHKCEIVQGVWTWVF